MSSTATVRAPMRADIQILRAAAALMVVGFHFWQPLLPGGFVGVDVFFVISGFLITTHLSKEAIRSGTIKLRQFWARRARRLLPSAYLVILVTSVLVFALQPSAMWPTFIRQAIASTFYFENWALAADSTNYLAADKPPTAVQQYWSLSAEEQFYIVWPVLILAAVAVAKLAKRAQFRVVVIVLGVITVASFAYSVYSVANGESAAYFSTFTRAWEFGLGGLIGAWMTYRAFSTPNASHVVAPRLAPVLGVTGWVGIAASLFLINLSTPFPGLWALLPVLSTALVILAQWSVKVPRALKAPLQVALWLGAISYAIYLWHWPLIVLYPYAMHTEPTLGPKLVLLTLTLVLAWLTTRFVETPIRSWKAINNAKNWRTGVVFAVGAAVVIAPAVGVSVIQTSVAAHNATIGAALAKSSCFGAETLAHPQECASKTWPVLQPDPALAIDDRSVLYTQKCISETVELIECHFGSSVGKYRVALIGDSHAASLYPAVEQAFAGTETSITTFTKFSCVYSSAPRSTVYEACTQWGETLTARLASEQAFDLVILTGYATNLSQDVSNSVLSVQDAISGFADVWKPLLNRGTRVVVVHDNPEWPQTPSNCLTANNPVTTCVAKSGEIFATPDMQYAAAQKVSGVTALSLNDYYCPASVCLSTVGGVTMYLDRSHISATYARTLGPILAAALKQ